MDKRKNEEVRRASVTPTGGGGEVVRWSSLGWRS